MAKKIDPQVTDRYLRGYQRACLFLLLPMLISSFACLLHNFNPNIGNGLMLSLCLYLPTIDPLDAFLPWLSFIVSLSLTAVYVPLCLLACKGKLWALVTMALVYAADFGLGIYLAVAFSIEATWLTLVIHGLFALLYGAAIFFYGAATRLLRAERN